MPTLPRPLELTYVTNIISTAYLMVHALIPRESNPSITVLRTYAN